MMPREPEEAQEKIDEVPVIEPSQDLEKALAETKKLAEDYLDSWKRTQADFINYKRRMEQERLETGKYANTQLILSILPILDDFDRALKSISPRIEKSDWAAGVKLIIRKLSTTLESQGLTPIQALGQPFDPNLHEAVMHGKGEEGIVIQDLRTGYKLYDKVIRPSNVIVGNGKPLETPKQAE
jgi:molecular chaperone GrpE